MRYLLAESLEEVISSEIRKQKLSSLQFSRSEVGLGVGADKKDSVRSGQCCLG